MEKQLLLACYKVVFLWAKKGESHVAAEEFVTSCALR